MSNTTECIEDFNLDKILFPFVYIFVVVVSIPVNCAFLCVSCIQVRKKNELAIYLFSLSLADLLYTLTLPLWIDYTWHQDNWRFSALLCQISAFLMYMNFYTSAAFLTCISIDRYLAVVHPLRFQHLRTRRFALLVSIFVWVLEGSLNCMILVMDETFTKVCNSTSHNLCNDKYPLDKWQAILNIVRICSGYMIPLAIMLFCYQKIYQAVRHNQATEDREKKKIKNLLLSITITFFFCFTPYHVVLLIRSINEPDNANVHMFTPYRITQALTSFNCIADPILYCFVSETGRTDILNMLKRCFCVRQSELQQPKDVTMISSITKNATTVTLKSSTEL